MSFSLSSVTLGVTAQRWVLVPAAGIGARMGTDLPKQYLTVQGHSVLEHTLVRLLALPQLAGIVLMVSPDDARWRELSVCSDERIHVVDGGGERAESVLNGLNYLALHAAAEDWVLVHDAARPCIRMESILNLCEQLAQHPVGGILGIPVADTLKRVDDSLHIQSTEARNGLWQAQTPQMFRYQLLHQSLARALASGVPVTDEASALEACGYQPLMVEGRSDNIKITRPEDLALATMILQQQEQA